MEIKDLNDNVNDSNKVGMYSFYDTKAKRYDTPFFCQNDMFAGRHYKMVTDNKQTMVNKFKKDFNVDRLGWFDQVTGTFTHDKENIITGKNIVKNEQKEKK